MTCFEYLFNLWVEVPFRWQNSDQITNLFEAGGVDTGVSDITIPLRVLDCVPSDIFPIFCIKLKVFALCVGIIEIGYGLLVDL